MGGLKLNQNEKEVLKLLIDDGRGSDTEIAEKLKISAQAVGNIRKRLEERGIIKGYCVDVDFKKLGIKAFAMIHFELLSDFWDKHNLEDIKELLYELPQMIFAARILDAHHNLVILEGFRNQEELEKQINSSCILNRRIAKIKQIDTFSVDSILKFNKKDLLKHVLDEKEFSPCPV